MRIITTTCFRPLRAMLRIPSTVLECFNFIVRVHHAVYVLRHSPYATVLVTLCVWLVALPA